MKGTQHSIALKKTTDIDRVTDLFFPLSLNVLVYARCECGCIHEDTLLTLSRLVFTIQLFSGWMEQP
ncbi:hypothetical protein DAPPUDRAFT_236102 [Daphnia pulex]|uniref:Uncharacterized protein n=1 Tax=Daphnia pulex TaxID=6669 RepID=E9FZZ1_DAPPU|nr:hypothetical protein DAPPUDRAFT_236102 [Daphnia pulex]|eukprot:EFX87174.1 hypothetical protein DAPPUDRAFT_236102 [Daphnia pulex]